MPKLERLRMTTPDLVVLSLLAEKPRHGYGVNAELERRDVRDWAAISRPQIYYSLEKLERMGFIKAIGSDEPLLGPERRVFITTESGRDALTKALEPGDWTTQRDRPRFLTWMALSWQVQPSSARKQIHRRQQFLERELARERATLLAIYKEVGEHHQAAWMVRLVIAQFKTELRWLADLQREFKRNSRKNLRSIPRRVTAT